MDVKSQIRKYLKERLHCVDKQQFDITNAIVTKGVNGFLNFDFEIFSNEILKYVKSVQTDTYAYKYASSCSESCLYASIYAVMIEGLLDVLKNRSDADKKGWADYLNNFQNPEDGLFYDPALECPAYHHHGVWNEGWGKHHLMGHIIIAFARLGYTPKYPLKYLSYFYDSSNLTTWIKDLEKEKDIWSLSNYIMNLYTVLEYSRDYMNDNQAIEPISTIVDWLLETQNKETGMWHNKPFELMTRVEQLNTVRGAYHFFPLFEYEKISLPNREKIVPSILPLQNEWGGWSLNGTNSGACEDIDAIDPLIRYSQNNPDYLPHVVTAVKKSLNWQFASRNSDGGFSFYVSAGQNYGGHPNTSSLKEESSMFATWFRTLCLAYEMKYLRIPNNFSIGNYPGYEISI